MGQGIFKSSYFYDLGKVEFTADVRKSIEKQLDTEPVIVYSKSYCPHCVRAKSLLESHGVDTKVVELNMEDDGLEIQAVLFHITGQKTVPNIFVGGKHVGGNSELQALANSGELKKLLDEAGISNDF